MRLLAVFAALLYAMPAHAEIRVRLPTPGERHAADIASWGTVLADIALDVKASWNCERRARCFELQGVRLGVTYGVDYLVKTAVHRMRPCAPNDCGIDKPNASFYSAHTAAAFQTLGGPRLAFALPFAIATGGLRVAAGKHWITDVLAGAGAGYLASKIR